MTNSTSSSLTIVLESAEATALCRAEAGSESGLILAFDPDAFAQLSSAGQQCLSPFDLLDGGDWAGLRALEMAALQFWNVAAQAPYGGLDLFRIAPFRHEEWLARCCWIAFVVQRALEKLQPGAIRLTASPGHGLTQPPTVTAYPPLAAITRFLAEQRGCAFELLSPTLSDGSAEAVQRDAASSTETLPVAPYVLFYANHVDVRNQLSLIRGLQDAGHAVTQVYKAAAPETLRRLRGTGHNLLREEQLAARFECWALAQPPAAVRRMCRAARERFGAADGMRLPALFDNPYLAEHFDFLFGAYLRKMAWNIDFWNAVFQEHPPELLIVNDQLPIAAVAELCRVPVLSLPHGLMVGETNWNSRMTPVIGALTPRHADLLMEAGVPRDHICVTGSPGLDEVLGHCDARSPEGDSDQSGKTILVCTSNFGLLAKLTGLPRMNWRAGLDLMAAIMELPRRHRGWRIVIKAHPRYDHAAAYELLRSRSSCPECVTITTTERLDMLAECAAAIVFPNPLTSSLIETAQTGKPTYLLSGAMIDYDPQAWALEGWTHCDDVAALEAALLRDLSDPTADQRAGQLTRSALAEYLGGPPATVRGRCQQAVSALLERAASAHVAALI